MLPSTSATPRTAPSIARLRARWLAASRPSTASDDRRQHGRVPGPEVLGAVLLAELRLEVVADLVRAHRAPAPAARGRRAAGHRRRDGASALRTTSTRRRVLNGLDPPDPALGQIIEHHLAVLRPRRPALSTVARPMPPSSSAYSSLPIRNSPTSSRRTAQASTRSRSSSSPAQIGQPRGGAAGGAACAKLDHVVELLPVAQLAPARVVEVLLASGGVDSGRLEMPEGIRADPDVLPCRRNRQLLDPQECPRDRGSPCRRRPSRRSRGPVGPGSCRSRSSPSGAAVRLVSGLGWNGVLMLITPRSLPELLRAVKPVVPSPLGRDARRAPVSLEYSKAWPRSRTPLSSRAAWPPACSSASLRYVRIDTQSAARPRRARRARPGQLELGRLLVESCGDRAHRCRARRQRLRDGDAPAAAASGEAPGDRPDRPRRHQPRRAGCGRGAARAPRLRRRRDRAAAGRHAARSGDDAGARRPASDTTSSPPAATRCSAPTTRPA